MSTSSTTPIMTAETETIPETKRAELAKAIAAGLGYVWSTLYASKSEWTADRGSRHDINTPYTTDFEEAVDAVLTALRTPSEEMVEAAFEAWTGDNWYATDEIKAAERAKLGPTFTAAIDVLLTPKDPEQ